MLSPASPASLASPASRLAPFAALLLVLGCGSSTPPADTGETGSGGATASSANAGGHGGQGTAGDNPGAGSAGGAGGAGGALTGYPAFLPSAPTVKSAGGPILTHPKIVPIVFAGDADQAAIASFVSALPASDYWKEVTALYGIGATTAASPVVVAETPPDRIDDAEVQTWLEQHLDATTGDWGAPDAGAIYAVFYPETTTFTLDGLTSCVNLGGYHSQATVSGVKVTYAIIGRCPTFQALTGLDVMTAGASHELLEAATDPDPNVVSAYDEVDDDHIVWELFPGAEVADMCDFMSGVYFKPNGLSATVERVWSNERAAAGHHPCAPAVDGEVYFNAVPLFDESVTVAQVNVQTQGVTIPVGTSKTIDIGLLSDAPTGPWEVSADVIYDSPSMLSFAFDKTTGVNGDTLKLTITANGAGSLGGSVFRLKSTLGGTTNFWIGFVAN